MVFFLEGCRGLGGLVGSCSLHNLRFMKYQSLSQNIYFSGVTGRVSFMISMFSLIPWNTAYCFNFFMATLILFDLFYPRYGIEFRDIVSSLTNALDRDLSRHTCATCSEQPCITSAPWFRVSELEIVVPEFPEIPSIIRTKGRLREAANKKDLIARQSRPSILVATFFFGIFSKKVLFS